MLINKDGVVNPALVKLVRLQGLDASEGITPKALNTILQQEWVKAKDGTFRAQLGGRFPTDRELELLKQLGADAIKVPWMCKYKGFLILGATMKAIARRMKFISDECPFRDLVPPMYFLGSGRPVDNKLEGVEAVPGVIQETGFDLWPCYDAEFCCWPKTETDIFRFLKGWASYHSGWWVSRDVHIVNTPGNPNTGETIKEWLKSAPVGDYLVVSSQPFCEGQKMAVERAVREAGAWGYTFDVCGPAAPPLPLSRWLDNLAKQLWEEVQLLPK